MQAAQYQVMNNLFSCLENTLELKKLKPCKTNCNAILVKLEQKL